MRAPRVRTHGSPGWIVALSGMLYLPPFDGMREGFADRMDDRLSQILVAFNQTFELLV